LGKDYNNKGDRFSRGQGLVVGSWWEELGGADETEMYKCQFSSGWIIIEL